MVNSSVRMYHRVQIIVDQDGKLVNEYKNMKICIMALEDELPVSLNLFLSHSGSSKS